VKIVQELMRHANSRLTLDAYAQALTPTKRAAHLKVVEMIRPNPETLVVPSCSHAEEVSACKRLIMERPIGIEPTPEPWQVWSQRNIRNLRGTFRSIE